MYVCIYMTYQSYGIRWKQGYVSWEVIEILVVDRQHVLFAAMHLRCIVNYLLHDNNVK